MAEGLGTGAVRPGGKESSGGAEPGHVMEKMREGAREASVRQDASLMDVRARVWELHVRGVSRVGIAREVGVHRQTVGRWLTAGYAELERERVVRREREVTMAVARLRAVQVQAWADHDADDERERAALAPVLGDTGNAEFAEVRGGRRVGEGFTTEQTEEAEERAEGERATAEDAEDAEGQSGRRKGATRGAGGRGYGTARYQSQRAHYLRVILEAEREIARLLGLYEAVGASEGAVLFRLERVS